MIIIIIYVYKRDNLATVAEYSMKALQSAVELNNAVLRHQELSVFIQANKFLGHSPDDFHDNLDAAQFYC